MSGGISATACPNNYCVTTTRSNSVIIEVCQTTAASAATAVPVSAVKLLRANISAVSYCNY